MKTPKEIELLARRMRLYAEIPRRMHAFSLRPRRR